MILAVIVFTTMKSSIYSSEWQFGWSYFFLCVATVVASVKSWVLVFVIKRRENSAGKKHTDKPSSSNRAEKDENDKRPNTSFGFHITAVTEDIMMQRNPQPSIESKQDHTKINLNNTSNSLRATQTTLLWDSPFLGAAKSKNVIVHKGEKPVTDNETSLPSSSSSGSDSEETFSSEEINENRSEDDAVMV